MHQFEAEEGIPRTISRVIVPTKGLGAEKRYQMRRTPTKLSIGIAALAFALAACTPGTQATASPTAEGDVSIVGTWNCGPPDEPERDVVEISADGTVTINQPGAGPASLTWTVEGDRVAFQGPPDAPADMGTIESQDRIVFDDGFVCTRAS